MINQSIPDAVISPHISAGRRHSLTDTQKYSHHCGGHLKAAGLMKISINMAGFRPAAVSDMTTTSLQKDWCWQLLFSLVQV